jgi:threonine aldolase
MRQIGVLCAAAYVAVRDNVGKLADDHRKAKALAGFKLHFISAIRPHDAGAKKKHICLLKEIKPL